jgi:hypothetical protein
MLNGMTPEQQKGLTPVFSLTCVLPAPLRQASFLSMIPAEGRGMEPMPTMRPIGHRCQQPRGINITSVHVSHPCKASRTRAPELSLPGSSAISAKACTGWFQIFRSLTSVKSPNITSLALNPCKVHQTIENVTFMDPLSALVELLLYLLLN